MEKFAVPQTGTEGLADAGDGRELLTVLPVSFHQAQVVVSEGGVGEKRRQDIGILRGEGDVRRPAGKRKDPEDLLDSFERHAEEGFGRVMGAVSPSEAGVLFDVPDENRGFVDHGELCDTRRKIDPVSDLDEIAQPVGGMDHEGFPSFSLQDQDGADIGVGQLQRPLQGDRK